MDATAGMLPDSAVAMDFSLGSATTVGGTTGSATSGSASSVDGPICYCEIQDVYGSAPVVEHDYNELCMIAMEEPESHAEAGKHICWRRAMQEELEAIRDNETWKLVELVRGQCSIGLKWVFKIKRTLKARW